MPGEKIARLAPNSNIVGISRDGGFLTLWNDGGTIRSAGVNLPELTNVRAIGGLSDEYARGVFAVTGADDDYSSMTAVYNAYWEGSWKAKEIYLYVELGYMGGFILFGNFRGKTYALYQEMAPLCAGGSGYKIVRFDYIGGSERYDANRISDQFLSDRRRLC